MANKKTQKDFYNDIIALAKENARQDIVDFAEGRIAALEKKAGTKKPTKTQEANVGIKADIKAVLAEAGKPMTVSAILATGKFAEGTTPQKITALLRQLIEAGEVVKTVDKKTSLFAVVTAEGEEVEAE